MKRTREKDQTELSKLDPWNKKSFFFWSLCLHTKQSRKKKFFGVFSLSLFLCYYFSLNIFLTCQLLILFSLKSSRYRFLCLVFAFETNNLCSNNLNKAKSFSYFQPTELGGEKTWREICLKWFSAESTGELSRPHRSETLSMDLCGSWLKINRFRLSNLKLIESFLIS